MIVAVLKLTFKIIVIMMIGFFFAKGKVIDDVMNDKLSALLTKIVLPISILSSSQQLFSAKSMIGFGMSFVLSVISYILMFIIGAFVAGKLPIPRIEKNLFSILIAFGNVGFIGFSIVGEAIGETGVLYAIAHNTVYNLFFFTYGIYLFTESDKLTIKALFTNKMIWISIISIILYVLPFRFPDFVKDTFTTVGGIMMPVSLVIVGAQIAMMDVKKILLDKTIYLVSLLKLIVLPAIMLGLCCLFNIDPVVSRTAVILSCLPSGSMSVIYSKLYKKGENYATIAVAQTMLFMIVVLPAFILLTEYIWGRAF